MPVDSAYTGMQRIGNLSAYMLANFSWGLAPQSTGEVVRIEALG
jgi:hypothetical protein